MSHYAVVESVKCEGWWFDHKRLKAIIALGVGLFLWFLPTLLAPGPSGPVVVLIDAALRDAGLLSASAGCFERGFTAALVVRWLAVVLLLLFVIVVEREPLSSLGIRMPSFRDVLLALALVVGTALVPAGQQWISDRRKHADRTNHEDTRTSFPHPSGCERGSC